MPKWVVYQVDTTRHRQDCAAGHRRRSRYDHRFGLAVADRESAPFHRPNRRWILRKAISGINASRKPSFSPLVGRQLAGVVMDPDCEYLIISQLHMKDAFRIVPPDQRERRAS